VPSIHFHTVSFSYSSAVDLLTDVSFDLGRGWSGLVGANGSGKSTLLSLIDGGLEPDAGSVSVEGIVGSCPQAVEDRHSQVTEFAHAWDGDAYNLRRRLKLDPQDIDRWPTLSPGERKRWQIGSVLATRPDILLLDEPTNHLDADGHAILATELQRFPGVGIIVSHDRGFLDHLTIKTLRLSRGALSIWGAPYSEAKPEWEAAQATVQAEYERTKQEREKADRRLADQRRAAETERARTKRQFRLSGPKDHDAHSAAAIGKAAKGDASMSKAISVAKARADRLSEAEGRFKYTPVPGGDLFFHYQPARRERLLSYSGPIAAGDRVIADEIDVLLGRTDRIRLAGRNGAGKTSLIRHLIHEPDIPPDRILYLPQETDASAAADLIARLAALPADIRGRVLQIVAALGADPTRILASESLSAGEARKLTMAFGMGANAWCLVLDEPTNHLDLPSIERLECALGGYPGAILMVTHDEHLAAAVTNQEWSIEELSGRVNPSSRQKRRNAVGEPAGSEPPAGSRSAGTV
jgi:ATPase subunit of ABC transporter with duplicated ATPase domains